MMVLKNYNNNNSMLLFTLLALSTTSSTTKVLALDADCQPGNAPAYNGFSLKRNTSCRQYVNCVNGMISSTHTCPDGLLFNGSIGVGGICNWEDSVTCSDLDPLNLAFDIAVNHEESSVSEVVVSEIQTVEQIMPEPQEEPPATVATTTSSNPDNYYCGTSATNAAQICKPCPSGLMTECSGDYTHGCFKNIDSCASSAASSSSSSSSTEETTASVVSESAPSPPSPTTTTTFVVSPTPPSLSPTLPPWTNAPFAPSPSSTTSKTVIGYYASWQWYDRNKFADPINIPYSKYDRINYAFFQPDTNGNLYGTDEWADPQLLHGPYIYNEGEQLPSNYKCSWDGPNLTNCNYHDTSKGLIQLAHTANVQVMPSIGGWTLSDNFPQIAADPIKRNNFAQQCIELIIAYGFDGIDIDWEYPGYVDHSGTPQDTVNFTLLLKAVRNKLDELGNANGKFYGLTAALPCGPDKINKIQVNEIKSILTEFNLMSYDLHGAWDALTGINAPMYDQGWMDKTKRWSVHGCVNNYVELGVPLSQMNIGLPFYGRSYQKATGMKQFHGGVDDINYHLDEGSPQYFNIVNELYRMKTYRHDKTQTQYAVFVDDQRGGLVSYDDARAICDKVEYANERGMHGFLVWEISGDMIDMGNGNMATPLIDATNTKIQNPNFDCSTLRDPLWALSDQTYRYAPDEPDAVDWSSYTAPDGGGGSTNDFNGAQVEYEYSIPAPAGGPTPAVYDDVNDAPSYNTIYNSAPTPPAVAVVPSPTPGSSSNDCPLDYTGYYATAGCTSYVYCQAGNVVGAALPCVPGTLFDTTISTCAYAENVNCGN